jgi:regulator of sigma D
MLTKNQQHQVIEYLDKSRLTLLSSDNGTNYDKLEKRISSILEAILKLETRDN